MADNQFVRLPAGLNNSGNDRCAGQAPIPAVRTPPVVGVDVLAKQGDFGGAARDEVARLGQDVGGGPGVFGTAGVGHDAEAAELVAAFLDREISCRALGGRFFGQKVELGFDGKTGVEDTATGR